MKLTPEQLKQNAAAMIAFAEGKPIQIKLHNGIWKDDDTGNLDGIGDNDEYRPKPEPKTRPWSKPDEFPVGKVVRHKISGNRRLLLSSRDGYAMLDSGLVSGEALQSSFTMDDGSPCEVTE